MKSADRHLYCMECKQICDAETKERHDLRVAWQEAQEAGVTLPRIVNRLLLFCIGFVLASIFVRDIL